MYTSLCPAVYKPKNARKFDYFISAEKSYLPAWGDETTLEFKNFLRSLSKRRSRIAHPLSKMIKRLKLAQSGPQKLRDRGRQQIKLKLFCCVCRNSNLPFSQLAQLMMKWNVCMAALSRDTCWSTDSNTPHLQPKKTNCWTVMLPVERIHKNHWF